MKKSMKKFAETKTPCRELRADDLGHVCGGTTDVPVKPPPSPWPR